MSYSKEQIIDELCSEIKDDIKQLYKADCINRKGKTIDTKEYYTEVIAKELLAELKSFEKIKPINRKSPYKIEDHAIVEYNLKNSNDREKIFSKRLYRLIFEGIGEVIDYQVPLKNINDDKGVGEIDLLSYNKLEQIIYLIELKYITSSNETLLRAILECFTYFKIVDQKKLIADYVKDEDKNNLIINPALLLVNSNHKPCKAYEEFLDLDNRPMLRALLLAMGIKVFTCQLDEIIISEFI